MDKWALDIGDSISRQDGDGDVTDTHQVWPVDGAVPLIPGPVRNGGLLRLMDTGDTVTCLDAHSGRNV